MSLTRIRRVSAFEIRRAESKRALVWGVAYPGLRPPEDDVLDAGEAALRIDSYRTWMRPETLERFAHDFMERGRAIDAHHDHGVIGTLVESYMTREGSEEFPADCWVAAVKVYDADVLAAVASGALKGFSIEMLLPKDGYREHVFKLAGQQKTLRTWELVKPEPTFLSLVKNPATGIAFSEVELRDDRAPWEREGAAVEGVTPLVRCADPRAPEARAERTEDVMPDDPTPENADPASTPQPNGGAPPVPEDTARAQALPPPPADAPLTREARVARVLTALASRVVVGKNAEAAPDATTLASEVSARVAQVLGAVAEGTEARASTYTDFGALWAATKDWKLFKASIFNALYLLENVFYEIVYYESQGDQAALVAQAVADFQAALAEVVAEYGPLLEGRAAEVAGRAGKAISAANLTKIQGARDACDAAMKNLDELLELGAGSDADDTTQQSNDAERARERLAVLERELAAARELAEARARDAAAHAQAREATEASLREAEKALATAEADLAAARTALTVESAARTKAEARVAEVERRVPAPRSGVDEGEALPKDATRAADDPFEGVITRTIAQGAKD